MRILFDSIFFEVANTGIARVWASILREWSEASICAEHCIYILHRSDSVPFYSDFIYIPFPRSQGFRFSGSDSLTIQAVCDDLAIDVFVSSYYTCPISTKTVMMVYDMIPEKFSFPMNEPGWLEKVAAIKQACAYVCISSSTADDLIAFHPEIPPSSVAVSYCGVDKNLFRLRPEQAVASFRLTQQLECPYWIVVGSRDQYNSYKNTRLLFNAIAEQSAILPYGILCAGGDEELEDFVLAASNKLAHPIKRLYLDDDSLSLAYQGSLGLVYPSLYEGFGMPVIEAMASGCPVITTKHGSLKEAGGEAACYIDGYSGLELLSVMNRIFLDPQYAQNLSQAGLLHASQFDWHSMALKLLNVLKVVGSSTVSCDFWGLAKKMRSAQSHVQL